MKEPIRTSSVLSESMLMTTTMTGTSTFLLWCTASTLQSRS